MESDKMKYLELKNTVEKLLDFMERYNLDDYNERLVKRNLNELLYAIDIDEIDLKKDLLEGNLKINNAKLKNQRSKKYYESIRIRK